MRGVAGFFLLALGLGVAAYAYYPSLAVGDGEGIETSAVAISESPNAPPLGTRVFSPQSPLFSPVAATPRVAAGVPAARTSVADGPLAPAPKKLTSSKPTTPEARADLVRDLQRELKRVGCYDGEIDGSWGGGSKRAMGHFTDRVNASLPVEEPDYILLTLVQGHKAAACGQTCPAGQMLSGDRCVPKAVLAHGTKRPLKADPKVTVAAAAAPAPVAAAPVAPAPVVTVAPAKPIAAPVTSPFATVVVTAPETTAQRPAILPPAPARPQHIARAEVQAPVPPAADPLPGRMAMGGPLAMRPVGVTPPVTTQPSPIAVEPVDDDPAAQEPKSASRPATTRPGAVETAPYRPAAVHAPPPRRDVRPQPQRYAGPAYVPSSPASRQRAMTYNLFQRPDRAGN